MSRGYSGSGEIVFDNSGLDDFQTMLEKLGDKITEEKALDVVEKGAKAFTSDLLRLPRPRRKIMAAGYTHLVNTFSSRRTAKDIEVGWGKYYGPMVEHGARQMKSSHPHMQPLFEQNKEKYYKTMTKELFD